METKKEIKKTCKIKQYSYKSHRKFLSYLPFGKMTKKLLMSALIVGSVAVLAACNKTPVEPEVIIDDVAEVEMLEPEVIILDAEDFEDIVVEEDVVDEDEILVEDDAILDDLVEVEDFVVIEQPVEVIVE